MHIVVGVAPGGVVLTDDDGSSITVAEPDFAAEVARREVSRPRWVWNDTSRWYPQLLAQGVRVERCVDLRLCHAILRQSASTSESELARRAPGDWDTAAATEKAPDGALFDFDDFKGDSPDNPDNPDNPDFSDGDDFGGDDPDTGAAVPVDPDDPVAEFALQQAAVAGSAEPGRIARLLAAESAGSLVAAEMRFAGMPWSARVHDEILTDLLGARPRPGQRPAKLDALLSQMRELLEVPDLNPDSPAELLKGLAKGGILATSTRSWELKRVLHPAIGPLLEYKKLSRLLAANGWNWVETWAPDGRFRPDYVVGAAATGRWGTDGGGALSLPKQVRRASVADAGWKLVVADAAQLEPRILAAMAADRAMIAAGAEGDLYAGIVASGAIDTREHAKVALLGAMYGATQGDGGRLMPQLERAYPAAIGMVEAAARAGEKGEVVSTLLGRSSPRPGQRWRELQEDAYGENGSPAAADRARSYARSWGRFTRNFIVQGTAAEWALCWMASLRRRLTALAPDAALTDTAHLVFFLHDELVVHTPEEMADAVADAIRASAREAGALLFGGLPADFPVTVAIVDNYGQAK